MVPPSEWESVPTSAYGDHPPQACPEAGLAGDSKSPADNWLSSRGGSLELTDQPS